MKSIRDAFGERLAEQGKINEKIVLISADLKVATKSNIFYENFPNRSFEVGIAEANAIGIAAGLGLSKYKPVLSSFSAFLIGKNVEIRTSIAYNNSPVVLIGTHGGFIGPDGATQSGIQDISIMRSMPRFKVFQPSTPILTANILDHCLEIDQPTYIRISRNVVPELYDENFFFVEGDPIIIQEFKDMCFFSSGPMVHNCCKASEILKNNHNINLGVIDFPSIKPINENKIIEIFKNTKIVFTVEDHMKEGGIGSALCEILSKYNLDTKVYIIGLNDFVSSGTPEELEKKYMLDPNSLSDFVLKTLNDRIFS